LLPVAATLCAFSVYKNTRYYLEGTNNSDEVYKHYLHQQNTEGKEHDIPILLINGAGFNDTQFLYGKYCLSKNHNLIFSFNYDGMTGIFADNNNGIDDIAGNELRNKINSIKQLTNKNKIILIGHSMGSMIAAFYTENYSKVDDINVIKVVSIESPFGSSPLLNYIHQSVHPTIVKKLNLNSKRHIQMSNSCEGEKFRGELKKKMDVSSTEYYCVWSENDYAVSGSSGCITDNPDRQFKRNYFGHYSSMLYGELWSQIDKWITIKKSL
jgi:triacylglycerol esterase/lipase EstA (alpha/beta hydrolase family)